MSAMGEQFLILEETADALDVIDPELAKQFRLVNGLPKRAPEEMASEPAPSTTPRGPTHHHEIRMDVGDRQIRCDCTCGAWDCAVDWDEIDTVVVQIREHLGSVHATSEDGITAAASISPTVAEKQVG